MPTRRTLLTGIATTAVAGCTGETGDAPAGPTDGTVTPAADAPALSLASPAFEAAGTIPTRFTCEGENVSPPLSVREVPAAAGALALVVDDPDAPGSEPFLHWLLWNVPPAEGEIPAALPTTEVVPDLGDARQGVNDAGDVGYTGPCPPRDDAAHTYRFTGLALDGPLDLPGGSSLAELERATEGRVLGRSRLIGTFDR